MVDLNYLNEEKGRHSKVLHLSHRNMKIPDYLSPNEIGTLEAKFIFYLRTRMVDVKTENMSPRQEGEKKDSPHGFLKGRGEIQ